MDRPPPEDAEPGHRRMGFGQGRRTPAPRVGRVLSLVGWNASFLFAGLVAAAAAGEAWFRLTTPFMTAHAPSRFIPGVGLSREPGAEVRWTNGLDFWTVSRANRLGFLDREPIGPERAARSCHVTVIGDSFVEAKEVPVADRFHVRLEALAAQELPHLDVTTSAFGYATTGQINQLPYYDVYARRLRPRLLALIFVVNDFMDNVALLDVLSVRTSLDPAYLPFVYAQRDADGTIRLRPPADDWMSRVSPAPAPFLQRVAAASWLAAWMDAKQRALFPALFDSGLAANLERLGRHPGYAALSDEWRLTTRERMNAAFENEDLPPVLEDALDFTAFALDRFRERAARDGVALVILSTHSMGTHGHPAFDRLHALAEARDIPVIDQYAWIASQGGRPEEANWRHDAHWNVTGHRWAAEALLEYLRRRPAICARPAGGRERPSENE